MACTSPLTGWRAKHLNKNGKRPIVFNRNEGFTDMEVTVPCGRCTSCRLEYSRQWAVRCMHEQTQHKDAMFVTLTIAPEHIQTVWDWKSAKKGEKRTKEKLNEHSISKVSLQRFFKRLRKQTGADIRYFACGEYGDTTHRPHYHAIIYGYDFPDKMIHTKTKNGDLLFKSEQLQKIWGFGFCLIGEVTFQSAAYVARYVMKKRKGDPDTIDPKTGKTNAEYYMIQDETTGEVFTINPEFCLMSRKPGLGHGWLEKYKSDTNKDFITLNGNKMGLPKYYDSILQKEDEEQFRKRKVKRFKRINQDEQLPVRMEAKRKVTEAKTKQLVRTL